MGDGFFLYFLKMSLVFVYVLVGKVIQIGSLFLKEEQEA